MKNRNKLFYQSRWNTCNANSLLQENEYAIQMVNHDPAYFLTSAGRVISLKRNKPRVLKPFTGKPLDAPGTGNNHRPKVCLRVNGKSKPYYVHSLVKEYFSVQTFIIDPSAPVECHHLNPSAPPDQINLPSNLLVTNKDIHAILTLMQGQQSTAGTWKLPTNEQAKKIISKLLNLSCGSAIFYETIDKATGKVLSTSAMPMEIITKENEE